MLKNRTAAPRCLTILSWLAILLATGCSESGPQRAPIKGKITIGGQPLAAGQILFVPVAPTTGPTASAAIKNGEFVLQTAQGPVVGTQRVELEAELPLGFPLDDDVAFAQRQGKPLPPNPIPQQYNRYSTLTTVVKADTENDFTFDVPVAR